MFWTINREKVKEDVKGIQKVKERHVPIEIRNITLEKTVYPRYSKAYSWLEKRYSTVLNEQDFEDIYQKLNTRVLIVKTGTTSDEYQVYYQKNDIKHDVRKPFKDTSSAGQHMEKLLDAFKKTHTPFVIMCILKTDENEYIAKEDEKLISDVLKNLLAQSSNTNIEMVFIVNSDASTDLRKLSCDIQYKLNIKGNINPIFCKTFGIGDHSGLRKRVGLYLERQFEAAVVAIVRDRITNYKKEDAVGVQNQTVSQCLNDKIIRCKEIISHLQHSSPDNCEMHELKVLLERCPDVAAYGFEDEKIMIFVEDVDQIPGVKSYLNKYIPEIEGKATFKIRGKDSKLSKCAFQQGSKIVRPDSKFGTLGLFLKDDRGNTYFTTCAHVLESNQKAAGDDNTILGRSVFSIDTGTDTRYSELIDLSIVRVEDSLTRQCKFGLRNSNNEHESGQIVDEESVHQERHLRVYKWGAATGLTRGTYKGWIAQKDQSDRFDQNLHNIVPDSDCMFEKGDSGSLICFEATGSPYLDSDSAGYIFVGKEFSKAECTPDVSEDQLYYCYHVSKVFEQQVDGVHNLGPCLEPNQ